MLIDDYRSPLMYSLHQHAKFGLLQAAPTAQWGCWHTLVVGFHVETHLRPLRSSSTKLQPSAPSKCVGRIAAWRRS